MSLSKDFLKGINFYKNKYGATSNCVIYAGEDVPEYLEAEFINFHNSYDMFTPKEAKFRLRF